VTGIIVFQRFSADGRIVVSAYIIKEGLEASGHVLNPPVLEASA
jgi:hypothetical protein